MDSDSDEIIIMDSEDEEAMYVEDIPYVHEEVVVNNPIPNVAIESPSLSNGEQIQLPSELPIKNKVSNNENEQSPQKRPRFDCSIENEDDGITCPICLDNWTNMGDHRVCALKCGHLFGLSCIIRWFSSQKKKSCPTCKKKAVKGDIRYIYAKKLIAMDASEMESIKKQLHDVTEEKNRIQIELTRAVCLKHFIVQEVEDLKKLLH